jgi:hypothetical protein
MHDVNAHLTGGIHHTFVPPDVGATAVANSRR